MGVLDTLDADELKLAPEAPAPTTAGAMKATLTNERFSDPNWIFERKLDGIRCIAIRTGKTVTLLSRNDISQNSRYPELVEALEKEQCDQFVIDGEVVAFDGSETSFARLAQRGHHYVPVFYYVFDILWLDGHDVRSLPLRTRKRLLKQALSFHGNVRWTAHRNRDGAEYFKEACRKGWEGLVAKRADSPYVTTRSRDWLKFKCEHGQELVVGGFTEPRGSRVEFGALLLGYYRDKQLEYAGKVGTGFDTETLHDLGAQLRALKRADPPFAEPTTIKERDVTWVEPKLVAEVGFTEWTRDGRLRHPRFLGLRDDKAASEVVREG
ncbi:MAG TPA: non-homologous end-joining DNA ligase [Solirubrobacteraceae bacterium]|jgi:DNA ligase D-like protein (predicted ligase)|nr:non-homologous end-joining DNA ligase [Solirubrobacteraceae bacterium]